MNHECTRVLKGSGGGQSYALECECGWSNIVKGDNPHEALVNTVNSYANHVRVAEASDGD